MIGTPATERTMTLSAVEFDVCWELLGLGETPVQLRLPSPGRTWAERRQIVTDHLTALAGRGLVRDREPVATLATALELLVRHEWSVDAALALDRPVNAIGAVRGTAGVSAVRIGDDVRLTPLDSRQVVTTIVALSGEERAAEGKSLSVRGKALAMATQEAGNDQYLFAERLAAHGEPPAVARALARMAARPIRQGQFGASVLVAPGTRRRARRVVAFHDTEAGRHLQLLRRSEGEDWLTVTPADNRKIATALHELLADARSG
ncbi:EspG family [Actinoalloteichus sp. GBA129-24]|nr:EspG family [Actinoalloteichus sp. GBA129-24]